MVDKVKFPDNVTYIGTKDSTFNVTFADGSFTYLGPETGAITFFYDTLSDEVTKKDGTLNLQTVKRNFAIEIRMRRSTYYNLVQLMIDQLKEVDEKLKQQSEEQKVEPDKKEE